MILLSVIIPTFQSANKLHIALDSLVKQQFKNFEILVVDGASKDGTVAIAEKYRAMHSEITILSESDKGIYDAMNKGICKARGEWLYFMGADDYLVDEKVLHELFENNVNLSLFDVLYGNVTSPVLGEKYLGEFNHNSITKWNICHQSIFFRKAIFAKLGLYNTKYSTWADWEFNLRWFNRKSIRKKYVDTIIAYFAPGGFSSEKVIDESFLADKQYLLLKYRYRKPKWKLMTIQILRMVLSFFK